MQDYDWRQKSRVQRIIESLGSAAFFLAWLYIVTVVWAHRLIPFAEIPSLLWRLAHTLLILALFPLIIFPVLWAWSQKYPQSFEHAFYGEWARTLTGRGKGGTGPVLFFQEDAIEFEFQPSTFCGRQVYLMKFKLKPTLNFLGKIQDITVGLNISDEAELAPLFQWARERQIPCRIGNLAMIGN